MKAILLGVGVIVCLQLFTGSILAAPAEEEKLDAPNPEACGGGSTGPRCIRTCQNLANGDYQSCKGCNVYATCSNGNLYDNRPCAPSNPPLRWDDRVKRCEWRSTTCFC